MEGSIDLTNILTSEGDFNLRRGFYEESKRSAMESKKKKSITRLCGNCGCPEHDHDSTGCNWRRHGALRLCNCSGFKEKEEVNDK